MNFHVSCEKKAQELRFLFLHIALTIFQALDDEGYIPFLEGVHHTPSFSLDAEDSLEAHVLQMVRSQGLLAGEHLADFGNRQLWVLLEQVNNTQAQRVRHRL